MHRSYGESGKKKEIYESEVRRIVNEEIDKKVKNNWFKRLFGRGV